MTEGVYQWKEEGEGNNWCAPQKVHFSREVRIWSQEIGGRLIELHHRLNRTELELTDYSVQIEYTHPQTGDKFTMPKRVSLGEDGGKKDRYEFKGNDQRLYRFYHATNSRKLFRRMW